MPHFEGFGIPILEAFSCHTAVITANNTSLPEVAGEAAILCESTDVDSIANAMLRLSTEEGLRRDLIDKSKEQAKRFSWDQTANLLWSSAQKTLNQA